MKILYPPFLENIKTNHLIQPNDTVILAFSGGKDSVSLFYLLQELKKDMDFHLLAAYFNHNLRTDAKQEQEWVRDFCSKHNLELVVGSKNVIEFKNRLKLNLEHAASLSRYGFFKEVSARFSNAKVATAHNRSDLSETFLIKLSRGSGLQGLTTIYSKKENTLIRPLLLFDQEDILAFLERNHISFYRDYTNEEENFLRNRIRRRVIPELLKIEPAFHRHVVKTVAIIQEEYDYFSGLAKKILDKHLILGHILPASILKKHHVAVQRHILREYFRLLKGNLLDIDFEHIEAVRLQNPVSRGLAIPGLELSFQKGFIFPNTFSVPGYSYRIETPGVVRIDEIRKTFKSKYTDAFNIPRHNHEILIPAARVKFPLTLRSPLPEDKYIKINTTVRQKVFEMIRSSGFPAPLRNLCPVLLDGDGEIIWAVGSPVADAFKIEDTGGNEFFKAELLKPNKAS